MAVIRRFYFDQETGETSIYSLNHETGESCSSERNPPIVASDEKDFKTIDLPFGCGYEKKNIKLLKERILNGSNTVSYILFLLPTLILWPTITCTFLMFFEIYVHIKCHQKNKYLKNPKMYYRSPFHPVTSTFCAICRDYDSELKVSLLQDQRRIHYDYLKNVI